MAAIVGIIPARGGSRRIPRKNLAPLAGRPLLAYTCEAALASRTLTRVLLSTDDEEIAAVGRSYGVEAPFLRPAELATDESPSVDAVKHALRWLEANDGEQADVAVLLQPTSPLRRGEHVDAVVSLLLESDADSAVSVVEVPHVFHPVSAFSMREDGSLVPYLPGEGMRLLRAQDKPPVYARSGPAVCATRAATIARHDSLFGPRTVGYRMSRIDSIDIDDEDDLALCEALLRARGADR